MKVYQVVIGKIASKELKKLPKREVQRIFPRIHELSVDPRPDGCKKLKSQSESLWRIRIGDYRVRYDIERNVVLPYRVRKREGVYRQR